MNKNFITKSLRKEDGVTVREEIKRNLFPLSLSQHNILDLEYSLSGTSVNNISTTIRIHGRLDLPVLQQTLNLLIEKDSTLRTRLLTLTGR